MARQGFQDQLGELEENILYMSELVSDRLRSGLTALEQKDRELAMQVIEGDDEINRLYLDLESDCIDLLALQQPVAGDLRFVASSFKIITDLERIGDLATNLGRYTLDAERDVFPDVDVQDVGDMTLSMLAEAMDAYDRQDPEACFTIAEQDDELDRMCERASEIVVRDLIETDIAEGEEVEPMMTDVSRLLLTIRDLERVGDHAVNIAARTLYMTENSDELIY